MPRHMSEVLVRRQQRQIMRDAQPRDQRVERADMNAGLVAASTSLPGKLVTLGGVTSSM